MDPHNAEAHHAADKLKAVAQELGHEIWVFSSETFAAIPSKLPGADQEEGDEFYELQPADYFNLISNRMAEQSKMLKTRKIREAELAAQRAKITKRLGRRKRWRPPPPARSPACRRSSSRRRSPTPRRRTPAARPLSLQSSAPRPNPMPSGPASCRATSYCSPRGSSTPCRSPRRRSSCASPAAPSSSPTASACGWTGRATPNATCCQRGRCASFGAIRHGIGAVSLSPTQGSQKLQNSWLFAGWKSVARCIARCRTQPWPPRTTPLPRPPCPLPGAMAGELPGQQEEGHLPHLQASVRRCTPPTRLFFQSTDAYPTQTCPSSQDTSEGADPEELATEVAQLEQKAASLSRVLEEQRDGIKKLNVEVAWWMEQAGTAEALREAARKEKECVQMLLNAKPEELSRKTAECGRLQEKSLALVKELAALKLSSHMNLQEEEILKLASLGNHGNLENAVDVLNILLAIRNNDL